MNLVCITPARNEGRHLGLTARAALMWCDSIIVLNHASTDDTGDIIRQLLAEYPDRVHTFSEPGERWGEMDHRQCLLDMALMLNATHVAPVDADEILAGDMLPTIRQQVELLKPGTFCGIPMKNLHRSINQYRADYSDFGSKAGTMLAFAVAEGVGWRNRDGYEHHQRSPLGSKMGFMLKGSGLLHLQFADWNWLLAKHAWYKAMERVKYHGKPTAQIEKTYSHAPNETGLQLQSVDPAWWEPYKHLLHHYRPESEPWHVAEVRRMVREHGADFFQGLNLYGFA